MTGQQALTSSLLAPGPPSPLPIHTHQIQLSHLFCARIILSCFVLGWPKTLETHFDHQLAPKTFITLLGSSLPTPHLLCLRSPRVCGRTWVLRWDRPAGKLFLAV